MYLAAAPDKERLAEPGPGRDHRHRPVRLGLARIDDAQILGQQMRHRVRGRLQIVEQDHAREAKLAPQRLLLDDPGQIRQVGAAREHRPGHVEAGGDDRLADLRQKGADHLVQPGKVGAVKLRLDQRRAGARLRREQRQQRLGAADIARDQHPHLPARATRSRTRRPAYPGEA